MRALGGRAGAPRSAPGGASARHRETTSSASKASPASHPRPVPSQGPHGRPAEGQWRAIKFQHLRRGEAESAPYKGGARAPARLRARPRKRRRRARSTGTHPVNHARPSITREGTFGRGSRPPRGRATRDGGGSHPEILGRWQFSRRRSAAFSRRVRVSRAVSGFRGLAGRDDGVLFFSFLASANFYASSNARLAYARSNPPSPNSETANGGKKKAAGATGKGSLKKEPVVEGTELTRQPEGGRSSPALPPGSTRPWWFKTAARAGLVKGDAKGDDVLHAHRGSPLAPQTSLLDAETEAALDLVAQRDGERMATLRSRRGAAAKEVSARRARAFAGQDGGGGRGGHLQRRARGHRRRAPPGGRAPRRGRGARRGRLGQVPALWRGARAGGDAEALDEIRRREAPTRLRCRELPPPPPPPPPRRWPRRTRCSPRSRCRARRRRRRCRRPSPPPSASSWTIRRNERGAGARAAAGAGPGRRRRGGRGRGGGMRLAGGRGQPEPPPLPAQFG